LSITIHRILHAGYIFDDGQTRIAFDPIVESPFSYNCYAYPHIDFDYNKLKTIRFDAIFISHYHDDHLSLKSLDYFDRRTPIYLYSDHSIFFELLAKMGFIEVYKVNLNEHIQVRNFLITAWRALEPNVDTIFQIQNNQLNILNVVDSWMDWDTHHSLSQMKWDLILWPFQVMREKEVLSPNRFKNENIDFPEVWVEQIRELKPRYIVPSSCQFQFEPWSWYNNHFFAITYNQFTQIIIENCKNTETIMISPGYGYEISENGIKQNIKLDWIINSNHSSYDYDFNTSVQPMPTSNIAQYFPQLKDDECKTVHHYCCDIVLNKFNSILKNAAENLYWLNNSKIWKMIVYNHTGAEKIYYYRIADTQISFLGHDFDGNIDWLTEIIEYKLFAALVNNESLTSLYIRINDCRFVDEVEKSLEDVDLLEDPLLQCLYSNDVGQYQKRQLLQINESIDGFLSSNKRFQ